MSNTRLDWGGIYTDYTQGWWQTDFKGGIHYLHWPTAEELAEKYQCSVYTIYDKMAKEKWADHKESVRAKLNEASSGTGRVGYYLAHSARADAFVLQLSGELFALVQQDIDLLKTVSDRLQNADETVSLETKIKAIEGFSKRLQENAKTLEILQATCRRAVGEPVSGIDAPGTKLKGEKPTAIKDPTARKAEIDKLIKRREQLLENLGKVQGSTG